MRYPPPSWRLRGNGLLCLRFLPVEQVRHAVPPELDIVSVAPGRTLGGLYLADYGPGSTRQYHELIAFPALVRRRTRVGAWISHIYVDDLQSLAAGREIWGLPKVFAHFTWHRGETGTEIRVADAETTLCSIKTPGPGYRIRAPLYAPVLSRRAKYLIGYTCKGAASVSSTACEIAMPCTAPFASLGIASGRCLQLNQFNLKLPKPSRFGLF